MFIEDFNERLQHSVVDKVVPVDTPRENATFKNRWIKTQLPSFVRDGGLYLDSDTLVRREISSEQFDGCDFAAVANHNGPTADDQIWHQDIEFLQAMGWETKFDTYYNGGVWYFAPSTMVDAAFNDWHRLWLDGVVRSGRLRDQPALNRALMLCGGIKTRTLPESLNKQIVASGFTNCEDATVWHFYSSCDDGISGYGSLLRRCHKCSVSSAYRLVGQFLNQSAPWKNQDSISRYFLSKKSQMSLSPIEKMWLNRQRRSAINELLSLRWV